ncbi:MULTISPECIES: class I adenylate-forming enzyme family protein [Phyllobacteriaceae]|jgi:long-chain acyl-CoA synthetase|uniref:AMP-dependent synthetase n=1 Tax=Mesorhizobium hungaricum TaxID=1566387 RepID=A0A1C2E547_9HYPH|nr:MULTISPECIES: class I adenylate-forming enzyme family protein [Mesorhizobium]MBN9237941.1 acyl--CoA ligase [Mesorhizobium sp.]MDQ0329746.1 amino acid adenylation domain-containing protein [Mesorhizobium sp. YL-MeA3-2017]OCX22036.1 AMP-dependent synthetase [Mesorhizobium hungaricum]
MRLEEHLHARSADRGQHTALVCNDSRLSYAELWQSARRLASSLHAAHVCKGDRVIVFMDNSQEAVIAAFAIWTAGAVLVPVHPTAKAARIAFVANHCRASVILAQGRLAPVVAESTPLIVNSAHIVLTTPHAALPDATPLSDCLLAEPLPDGSEHRADKDLAAILYTSGSTGEPKGVMMTHVNLDAATGSIVSYLENTQDDVILSVLPLSFGYGLTQLMTAVVCGGTLVLEKSFAFPYAVFERLQAERATGFPLVPSMVAMMLQMRELDPVLFSSLRYVTSAAAPLPVDHIHRLRTILPDARFYSMYGQTECIRASFLPPSQLEQRPGSVGIAIPGAKAYVVDDTGRRTAPGAVGELVISGPNVMQGYWEAPQATAAALRPDPETGGLRLHTGDLFTADAQGFLTFVSRRDDIIKSRGEKVSPKEVEAVLHTLPGIVEALVVGVPDPVLGQAIKALVVPAEPGSISERDVLRHCASLLEDYMVPKSVEFVVELPKTETGKLSRRLAATMPTASEGLPE